MFSILKGIVPAQTIQRLQALALTKEDQKILEHLYESVSDYNKSQALAFIGDISFQIFMLSISLLGPFLQPYLIQYKILTLILSLSILFFSLFVKLVNSYKFNIYHRSIKTLLTVILEKLFQNYRLSLATTLSEIPKPHIFTESFAVGAFALISLVSKLSKFIAISFTFTLGFILFLITNDFYILLISSILLLTILLSLIIFYYGRRFSKFGKDFSLVSDAIYQDIKDSSPINIETSSNYLQHGYFKILKPIVNSTQYINSITLGISAIISLLIIISPILIPSISSFIYLLLPIASLNFLSGFVNNDSNLKTSIRRHKRLQNLISIIENNQSEMTPTQYEKISRKPSYVAHPSKNENIIIKNLKYISGRNENKKEIFNKEIQLETGKVNILSGQSGIGKSILGRLITMKYAEFNCDFIGKGNYDFRKYNSLENAHKELLFSGLREIDTSYRAVISIYASQFDNINNSIIKDVFDNSNLNDDFDKFLLKNITHYNSIKKASIKNLFKQTNIQIFKKHLDTLSDKDSNALGLKMRKLYKQLTNQNLLELIDESTETGHIPKEAVLSYLFRLEYFAYQNIKTLIPEASLYFMDAILSEPPISQGQRRRILFALDIVLQAHVFVIDEPSANLDFKSSKLLLNRIIRYTKVNNSTTLILEPKENHYFIEKLQKDKILGYNYVIEKNSKNKICINQL